MVLKLFVDHHDLGQVMGPDVLINLASIRQKRLPDVMFVSKSRLRIIGNTEVEGPPDLIIEVVSPESADRDWLRKFSASECAGVKEYWVIDPLARRLEANHLEGGRYQPITPAKGKLESGLLSGFYLKEQWVFKAKRPSVLQIVKELGVTM